MENYWSKTFNRNFTCSEWKKIYLNSIHKLPSTKLTEFSYKMIHGLLVSREILYKWKRVESSFCPTWKEMENVKHIYFDCKRIQEIWNVIGRLIGIKVQWKHIILGFAEDLVIHKFRNTLFKIVLYAIFKSWLQGIENKDKYIIYNMVWQNVLNDIHLWNKVLRLTSIYQKHPSVRVIWNNFYHKL